MSHLSPCYSSGAAQWPTAWNCPWWVCTTSAAEVKNNRRKENHAFPQNFFRKETAVSVKIQATRPTDVFTSFPFFYLVKTSQDTGTLPELIALKEKKITINPHHHWEPVDGAKAHNPRC